MRTPPAHRPFHSVRLPFAPRDVRELCRAYLPVMPEGAYFSHQTAADLLGVPLPAELCDGALQVSVAFPRTPPRGRGVNGHSLGSVRGAAVDGLPVCRPALVWCQLSGVLDREDLVAAADHLVGARKRAPVVTLAELTDAAEALQRTKGARARAWALPRIRFGADSRPETLLRLRLEECGLTGLAVNRPVAVRGGGLELHPDLSLPDRRIAFEYEGDGHRVDRRQWHTDIERRDLLEAEQWRVMRVTALDLFGDRDAFRQRLGRFVTNVDVSGTKDDIRDE
jgi:very-short-patch-repair endonuclease